MTQTAFCRESMAVHIWSTVAPVQGLETSLFQLVPVCFLPPLGHLHWDITACNQNMMMCLWREVVVSDPLMSRGLDHSKRHLVKTKTCFWVVKWGCELWSSFCVTLIMALGQNAKLQARYLCFYTHMGLRQMPGFKALSGNICSKWFTPNVAVSHDMKARTLHVDFCISF